MAFNYYFHRVDHYLVRVVAGTFPVVRLYPFPEDAEVVGPAYFLRAPSFLIHPG